jgi:hypothetical protein
MNSGCDIEVVQESQGRQASFILPEIGFLVIRTGADPRIQGQFRRAAAR